MEYQEAMSELGALQQTFLQVGSLQPSHCLSQATINAAAYIVLSSVELIGEFLERLRNIAKDLLAPVQAMLSLIAGKRWVGYCSKGRS